MILVSNVSVWFLTDGEETVYLKEDGSPDRIPSNKADPKYNFFTMVKRTTINE